MGQFIDLTGQRFGKLIVLGRAPDHFTKSGTRITMWNCKCDCGNKNAVAANALRRGLTASCGCYSTEVKRERTILRNKRTAKYDGGSKERLFPIWKGILHRCYNPKDGCYEYYGGRGITVCEEWKDYTVFKTWALSTGYDKDAPFGQCTIDRIDVDGNYCPQNCRWVDAKTQANNRRPRKKDG